MGVLFKIRQNITTVMSIIKADRPKATDTAVSLVPSILFLKLHFTPRVMYAPCSASILHSAQTVWFATTDGRE